MSKPVMKGYPAEFKERAVKLAVESGQPIAQTARALGSMRTRSIPGSGNITGRSAGSSKSMLNISTRN
jgi:hypothetical protein